MRDRRRNSLVLLIVVGLLAASAAGIALKPTLLGLDLKGGVSLVYKAKPTAQSQVTSESMTRTIEIMRKRVDQLGVSSPEILRTGKDEINVNLPDVSNAKRAEEEVGKTAQMDFYDWETDVIGPNGKPAGASEPSVSGGANAAAAASGISKYEAVERAAKRKPEFRKNETTYTPGCTPQLNAAKAGTAKNAECLYGQWYLVNPKAKTVVVGPTTTEAELEAKVHEAKLHTTLKPVLVPPGTIVVGARPEENAEGKVVKAEPERFYVLKDEPVLSGSNITDPREESENGNGQPVVAFGFSGSGGTTFQHVRRDIAKRGEEAALPGVSHEGALQHFAIVLDEQVITAPSVDYKLYPEGIDATNGSQISGGFTLTSAQNLA